MFEFVEDEELRSKLVAEHEENVKGLKANNEALLKEKKSAVDQLSSVVDLIENPEAAREALKFVRDNEYAQLIQAGKFDEVVEKKVSAVRQEAKDQIDALTTQLTSSTEEATVFKSKYLTKIVDDGLRQAAIDAGVRAEALEDVLLMGRMEFNVADDNETVESRDTKGNLRKNADGIVVTPKVWLEGLKSRKPYLWPNSESAGFTGKNISDSDAMAKLDELILKGDMAGYRKLRESMKK